MKKASRKIKSYAEDISIIDNQIDLRTKFLYFFIFTFISFFVFYSFFITKMVFNIIERKTVELQIRDLSTEVGQLESSYSLLSNEMSKDNYETLGFKEVKISYSKEPVTTLGFNLKNDYSKLVANEI